MPIYEYLCQNCAYRFELKQGIKDDPIKTCSRCGQEVTKLISSPAIMFKGSGWYVTDYSDKLKPTAGAEGSEKANDAAGDGKKSEPATTDAASAAPSVSGESSTPSTAPPPSTSGTSAPSSNNPSSTSSSSSSSSST
ncbi:MAG: FmdB family zinc ribbon protein [Nitrospiraceae bacterium]